MKLAVRPTGGTAPEAPCRAPCNAPASEGGACYRLSPPKGDSDDLEAAISFLLRTRSRGHFQPLFFLGKLSGKKCTGIRLTQDPCQDGGALAAGWAGDGGDSGAVDLSGSKANHQFVCYIS